ncbi:MAG TPA: hypothetical protein VEZ16_06390 [Microvirga sp.]|nr:hypothetical protein [Microvirga sp.]
MTDDRSLREEIRLPLDDARAMIRNHTGLYPHEDLTADVLGICDEVVAWVGVSPRLEEARALVEERCARLVQAADRFAERNLAMIAMARAQAIAAVDMLQDAALERRRMVIPTQTLGSLLRRRSL